MTRNLTPFLLALLAPTAAAQFDDQWAEYAADPSLISAGTISSVDLETDLAWADLDQDGAVDLVVVRVEPIMAEGPRTNLLLMNEGGVLVDRTTQYASASDVPGDQGFDTATADRDVVIVDVDNDGWLDVVTCVGFGSIVDPKAVSHPRIYMNLGEDVSGDWLGLRYEEARIPVLINGITGLPVVARFNGVAAGDVTGDGFADLYFVDHDASSASPFGGEPPTLDTDDRLFVNDGTGFFTDATAATLAPMVTSSNFGNSCAIEDFNGNGVADIMKQTNLAAGGAGIGASYNDDASPGTFSGLDQVIFASEYAFSTGDLNDDGRLDLVVSSNGLDGIVYNESTAPDDTVDWSAKVPFDFISGADDSFAANSLVADLDGDGLEDVMIADVDPQITGYNRRLHIYHNRGIDGSNEALLREERESASDLDWIGFVGPSYGDLNGTHDIAFFDVDLDGLEDVIVSRRDGTVVWRRVEHCQPDLGFGTPGLNLEVCGNKLADGNQAEVRFSGGLPGAPVIVLVSLTANPFFLAATGDTVLAWPPVLVETVFLNGSGELALPLSGGNGPFSFVLQGLVANGLPDLADPTNAVEIQLLD